MLSIEGGSPPFAIEYYLLSLYIIWSIIDK